MQFFHTITQLFLHLDTHLAAVIAEYGAWTYALLFLIIFCETGLVVTPFLPGDSLLFAAGAFAAQGSFNIFFLGLLLLVAAIVGDGVNYWIGSRIGRTLLARRTRWINPAHIARTQVFYEKYGSKTIVLARFVPIVRTIAPFVAGIGRMGYPKFMTYNIAGAVLWVTLFLGAGYLFGNIPVVEKNFTLVIFAIIGISVIPGVVEFVRHRGE
jgi:membrane-associated protein